jgi:hypothetical protein
MIPKMLDVMGYIAIFQGIQSVAILLLCIDLTDAYNIIMLVSGYQSIDMHCIVFPVKFDGEFSISFLRNRQLLTEKGGPKITLSNMWSRFFDFKTPLLEKGQTLEKVVLFWSSFFL